MWKKWRKESEEETRKATTNHKNNKVEWLEKIEQTQARLKKEVEEKKAAKEKYAARRGKFLQDQKIRQEKCSDKNMRKEKGKQRKRCWRKDWPWPDGLPLT